MQRLDVTGVPACTSGCSQGEAALAEHSRLALRRRSAARAGQRRGHLGLLGLGAGLGEAAQSLGKVSSRQGACHWLCPGLRLGLRLGLGRRLSLGLGRRLSLGLRRLLCLSLIHISQGIVR